MTRRTFLLSCLGAIGAGLFPGWAKPGRPRLFGAIRWDAQYCDTPGQPCFEEERALGKAKWQSRAPLHSEVLGPDRIRFAPTQATFDAEIVAARQNNLAYWAYLLYGQDGTFDLGHSMMKGLALHRSSPVRAQMNYAAIAGVDMFGRTGNFDKANANLVSLMRDANYQTVLGNRPVLFILFNASLVAKYWSGDLGAMAAALDGLRDAARQGGLGNPYVIVMDSPPAAAEKARIALRADAISVYAIAPGPTVNGSFVDLDRDVRSYWDKEAAVAGAGVVPTVMIGWDTRPRKETPPAYDHRDRSQDDPAAHITAPTPSEFAAECQAAADFIDQHPQQNAARLALIYAWNEDSEGGPLEPTLGDPKASRLVAAGKVIR